MCFHFAVFLFLEILLKLLIWNMLTDDSVKCGSTGSLPLANSDHELLVSMTSTRYAFVILLFWN